MHCSELSQTMNGELIFNSPRVGLLNSLLTELSIFIIPLKNLPKSKHQPFVILFALKKSVGLKSLLHPTFFKCKNNSKLQFQTYHAQGHVITF